MAEIVQKKKVKKNELKEKGLKKRKERNKKGYQPKKQNLIEKKNKGC